MGFARFRKQTRAKPFKLVAWEPDETSTQIALVECLRRFAHPNCLWFSIPNQRNATAGERVTQWKMGLRKGASDLAFLFKGKTLFMECKTSVGRQGDSQAQFEADARAAGGEYVLVRSLDEAIVVLRERGIITRDLLLSA
jgi:hypothetical protein